MAVTIETVIGLVTVSLLWGITNPFMKKGAKDIEKVKSASALNQIFKDVLFLFTNIKYLIPFAFNQIGSVLYIFLLQKTDLSLSVVVVNALAFIFTALTGAFLGEAKAERSTYIGIILVLLGVTICCYDKMALTG